MPLPPILNADTQTVTIEMTSKSELFTYWVEDETVYLASAIRAKFIAGLKCPVFSEINLEFLLTSEEQGEAKELLKIYLLQNQN